MSSTVTKEEAWILLKGFVNKESSNQKVIEAYNENASKYEGFLTTLNYGGPKQVSEYTSAILKDKFDAKILDVGAGSGLAGIELQKLGYTNLHAVDASKGLLEMAKSTGIYKEIMCQYVGADTPLPVNDDTYDMAVLCGAMSENHLPLSALDDVIRVVHPGGHIINVFREEVIRMACYDKFDEYLGKLEQEGKWKQITRQKFPVFLDDSPGLVLVHQVL